MNHRTLSGFRTSGWILFSFLICIVGVKGEIWYLIDIRSFLLVTGITFLLLLANFGKVFPVFFANSILSLFYQYHYQNKRFSEIAKTGIKYTIYAGSLGLITGTIEMLGNLSDPSAIGPSMPLYYFPFITLLYYFFFLLL
ncbi:MAG: hypothetical protein GY760_05535 [Deltaproteobacteria bacterium]|nr:hypothetical protein [Deltaproteobacteria bacterium]